MELALLIRHAQWSQDNEHDGKSTAAARLFAHSGVDLIVTGFQDLQDFGN